MINSSGIQPIRVKATILLLLLLGGCSALRPAAISPPSLYSLDNARSDSRPATRAPDALSISLPTLIVNPTHAAAGFDSRHIFYLREPHKLEYFAQHEWVDTPARMIAPLIVASFANSAAFRAVVLAPSSAAADLRLDTEIVRLQQEFSSQPSRVRFTLRAYLLDTTTRRVLAARDFDEVISAASDDPEGGIVAANRAVASVLQQLASFCDEAAHDWLANAAATSKVD
jgi:cholesterol transport system auxiliary component